MPIVFEQAITCTVWADKHIAQGVRPVTHTDQALLTAPQPLALNLILETIVQWMAAMCKTARHRVSDIDLLYYLRHKSSYATGTVV